MHPCSNAKIFVMNFDEDCVAPNFKYCPGICVNGLYWGAFDRYCTEIV